MHKKKEDMKERLLKNDLLLEKDTREHAMKNNYAMIFPNGIWSMVYHIVAIHNKKPITSMNCIIFLHIHLYIFSKLRANIYKENHRVLY